MQPQGFGGALRRRSPVRFRLPYPCRIYAQRTWNGARACIGQQVKRNRIKRQLREAYRLQKDLLQPLEGGLDIAFLWTSDEMLPTEKVFQKVQNILQRIHESVAPNT